MSTREEARYRKRSQLYLYDTRSYEDIVLLNLRDYVKKKERKKENVTTYTLSSVRFSSSSAVIFNHYRSPLVISAEHSSLNCAAGCIQEIVRNICEIGVGN